MGCVCILHVLNVYCLSYLHVFAYVCVCVAYVLLTYRWCTVAALLMYGVCIVHVSCMNFMYRDCNAYVQFTHCFVLCMCGVRIVDGLRVLCLRIAYGLRIVSFMFCQCIVYVFMY